MATNGHQIITAEDLEAAKAQLDELMRLRPEQFEAEARIDSTDDPQMSMRDALAAEGITPQFVARTLKMLLSTAEAKWNSATRSWDYFIPGKLWKDTSELCMKVFGSFAPETQVNLHVDAKLSDLLQHPGLTPQQVQDRFVEYISNIANQIDEPVDIVVRQIEDGDERRETTEAQSDDPGESQ